MTKKIITFLGEIEWHHQLPHRVTPSLVTPLAKNVSRIKHVRNVWYRCHDCLDALQASTSRSASQRSYRGRVDGSQPLRSRLAARDSSPATVQVTIGDDDDDGKYAARRVDKIARKCFPLAFLLFNIGYWIVYTLLFDFITGVLKSKWLRVAGFRLIKHDDRVADSCKWCDVPPHRPTVTMPFASEIGATYHRPTATTPFASESFRIDTSTAEIGSRNESVINGKLHGRQGLTVYSSGYRLIVNVETKNRHISSTHCWQRDLITS